ncbi:MAG: N-acyl homoserine lactonase family protein [Acidimicrobiales bacterium]
MSPTVPALSVREMVSRARRLFVLRAGGERTLLSLFDPWDPACGSTIEIPYYFYAIDHPGGWTLVDCGAHPDFATDPVGRLGEQAAMSNLTIGPGDDVASQLATIGVDPAQVRHVVLTHLHYDHCGGLSLLPAATVHVQEAERRFAERPPIYQAPAYIPADWSTTLSWNEVRGEHDLFGDGSVVMFPTPGHTPGHQSVMVRLEDQVVIIVGDAAYHPAKMAERRLPAYLWSPDAVVASWEELERLRNQHDACFLFSHYPAPDRVALAPQPWHP